MRKSLARRATNRLLHIMAQFGPGARSVRPYLHKLRGVNIQGRVFIGDQVYIENEYPEAVEIHDGAQIALRSIIMAHLREPGRVVIGPDAFIGPNCFVWTHDDRTLTIGEGSVVAACSVITRNVPPFTFVTGSPAKPVARVTTPLTYDTPYDDFMRGLAPL